MQGVASKIGRLFLHDVRPPQTLGAVDRSFVSTQEMGLASSANQLKTEKCVKVTPAEVLACSHARP